jgi:hypothetical protein
MYRRIFVRYSINIPLSAIVDRLWSYSHIYTLIVTGVGTLCARRELAFKLPARQLAPRSMRRADLSDYYGTEKLFVSLLIKLLCGHF